MKRLKPHEATDEPHPVSPHLASTLATSPSSSPSFVSAASLLTSSSNNNALSTTATPTNGIGRAGTLDMTLPPFSPGSKPLSSLKQFCDGGITEFAAVVISSEEPMKTRGTDYVIKLMVADDSKDAPDDPDTFLRAFCYDPSLLPSNIDPGDVILCRDVRSERYNNRAACIAKVRALGKGSKIGVFCCPQPDTVQQTWPKHSEFPLSNAERARVIALWAWHRAPTIDLPAPSTSHPSSPIKPKITTVNSNATLLNAIPPGTVFTSIPDALKQTAGRLNVLGQVRKIFHPRESTSFIVVAMWDGTGERAKSAPIDAKLPPYGASLPVKFWREFFNYFDVDHGEIREGAWLACLGLVVQVYHETPEVKSRADSQLVVLEANDPLVKERKAFIETRNRMAGVSPLNPGQWIMVNPAAINIPVSSIEQVRAFPHDCYVFRLKARVTGYSPASMNDSTAPFCPKCEQRSATIHVHFSQLTTTSVSPAVSMLGQYECTKCNKIGPAEWKFLVRLQLEDESTQSSPPLVVLVHSEFFREFVKEGAVPNMSAPSSYSIADMVNALFFRTMKAMRGEQDICVFSYSTPNGRAYQVCHSSIVIQRNES